MASCVMAFSGAAQTSQRHTLAPIAIAILRAFNTALIFSWWRTVRDTCDGGSGTDTAAAYEIRLNIP
jgi:hypothetical protein